MKTLSWMTVALCLVQTLAVQAKPKPDIGKRLEKIAKAYLNIQEQYPSQYTCEIRSPELVASMDEKGRKAWGQDGYVLMEKKEKGVRLTAQSLADPKSAPIFNIVIGLWQLRIALQMKQLEGYVPTFMVAGAAVILGGVLQYEPFEKRSKGNIHFGLRARNRQTKIQEFKFVVTPDDAIQQFLVTDKDGSTFDVRFKNVRTPRTGNKWLVTQIHATRTRIGGKTDQWKADLGYLVVDSKYVMYQRLAFLTADEKGKSILKPNEVNPVSYNFSNYKVIAGPVKKKNPKPDLNRLGP